MRKEDMQIVSIYTYKYEYIILIADLIINFNILPHEKYKRDGNNLIYIYNISLKEALLVRTIEIITLDNRGLNFYLDEIITPQTVKTIKNEGIKIENENFIDEETYKSIGDLYIKFNIIFPAYIPYDKKEEIIEILKRYE